RLTAEQHYSFGYFFFCAEDFVSARMAFSRAIRLDSDHDAKKFGIGIFHEKYRRWDLAGKAYQASAEDTSDDQLRAEFYRRAGYCFEAALELTSARNNYDQALEYAPRNREVWRESAVAAELDGDYVEALDRYKIAWGLGASADVELNFRIGYVLWKLGKSMEALDYFARFVGETDGIGALEQASEHTATAGDAGTISSDIIELTMPTRRLGAKAHISWADTFYELKSWEAAARHYRLGFLAGGITRAKLRRQVESLLKMGMHEAACRTMVEWRANPEPSPLKVETPRRGGIEARNIDYEQFRRNLDVQP